MNLNDEVICGHLVTAQKKRANAVYLDLLREFDRLCSKAGLTWWMAFGSLIGAVRHQGFIPWDDDVDLLMPRKDFDRLLRLSNEEFGAEEPYFLQTPHTDPKFQQRILRFRRSDTAFITQYDLRMSQKAGDEPYNMGLALAIFPLDNYPKSRLVQRFQQRIGHMGVDFRTDGGEVKKRPLLNAAFRLADKVVKEKTIVNIIHGMYRLCRRNRSGLVHSFEGFYQGQSLVWPAEDFQETVMLPFEDITVPAPAGYDHILSVTYGDYMAFPPEAQRVDPHGEYISAEESYVEVLARLKSGELVL